MKIQITKGKITRVEDCSHICDWGRKILKAHDATDFPDRYVLENKIMKEVIGPSELRDMKAQELFGTIFSKPATLTYLARTAETIRAWENELCQKFDELKPSVVPDGQYKIYFNEGRGIAIEDANPASQHLWRFPARTARNHHRL
jgi:hypothetical protein